MQAMSPWTGLRLAIAAAAVDGCDHVRCRQWFTAVIAGNRSCVLQSRPLPHNRPC